MKTVIEMAREAEIASWHKDLKRWVVEPGLDRFAALARADEREAIAKMVEDWDSDSADPRDIAAAIRARGQG